ncbi:hypothetical protein WOLCODRAFT_139102 [Wolfiporia cocos MD-104 SS10]|uniref:Uncharacterized protein n=1 Tax=Wolfiporia cocos (strain MD-104) TaxID=742152 RepID=A0A2H3K6C8_WOLCO|nr:hypothetical protein WOLCODRAFT_139102 [Wolfiporia cocos MD-104 SS10]
MGQDARSPRAASLYSLTSNSMDVHVCMNAENTNRHECKYTEPECTLMATIHAARLHVARRERQPERTV